MEVRGKVRMYGPDNEVDPVALKAVRAFNPLIGGRYDAASLGGVSEADFQRAVSCGMLFRPSCVLLDHDAAVARLIAAVAGVDPRTQADLFLAGLSTDRLDYRAGLGSIAIARTFPAHGFAPRSDGPYCSVCGMTAAKNDLDLNLCNAYRFRAGAPINKDPLGLAFTLECQRGLRPVSPSPADFAILGAILGILRDTPPDETAKKIPMRQIKSIAGFKSRAEHRQYLIETLGYCGILETPKHGGMLTRYVNQGLAPRKTHSSDWNYPVDFWTGADGLNKDALRFWFGGHPELASFL